MKKYIVFLSSFLLISCSEPQEQQTQNQQSSETFTEQEYAYNVGNLSEECSLGSEIACAVESAVKCTLKPDLNMCADLGLPSFIFLDDESLQRPTEQTFEITKLKPLSDGFLEVYTKGTCNGNMFGLCSGNIIYVLKNKDDKWKVSDIYAVE